METKRLVLGQKIKRYRLINDIRQEDMAEKMNISRATLINYEKGHTTINLDVLNRFKKHYPDFDLEENTNTKPKIIVDGSIDFKVIANVLSSKKTQIIVTAFIFTFIGISSSFLFKKYYEAEITLYPAKDATSQGLGQFQSLASNLGINTANKDQNFNIPDVVKSRLIATKAVNQKWKIENGEFVNLVKLWKMDRAPWYNFSNTKNQDSIIYIEKAIKKFSTHIDVFEDKFTGLIKISSTFQDPLIAAAVANFISIQVEKYIQKENSAQSTREKIFISDRLSIVKIELEESELSLKDFKERNRGYEDSPELFMIYSQLFREVEAKKEVYLTLQQQLELARIEEVKQSPILHILDHAAPPIQKKSPNRKMFALVFGIMGILFSSLREIFRY
tara:strand:+ start:46390 stop:47559 length:1170 start_codon:yes stop_codon:yes gene_type:complete